MPSAGDVVQRRRAVRKPGYLATRAGSADRAADATALRMLEEGAAEEGGRLRERWGVEVDSSDKTAGRAVGKAGAAESQEAASQSVSVGRISKEISGALLPAEVRGTHLTIQCSLCWKPEPGVKRREIPVVLSERHGRLSRSITVAVLLLVHDLCTLPSERRSASE
jgi:hypothetical protein